MNTKWNLEDGMNLNWCPKRDSNRHALSNPALLFGGMPRTRTEKHFVLSEIGIPIPFNIPISLKIPVLKNIFF